MIRGKSIFIAAAVLFALFLGACSNPADAIIRAAVVQQGGGDAGGGSLNVEQIIADLQSQIGKGGPSEPPAELAVTVDLGDLSQTSGTNWRELLAALNTAGKYVTLDISDSTITGTSFNHNNYSNVPGMDMIVDITLPEGITSIGEYAFLGCPSLALTDLPSGITSIGVGAFANCINLALTDLPAGITSIGIAAFSGCTSLTQMSLLPGITSIESSTFQGCINLTQISLPAGITSIGVGAFYDCIELALTSLPSGITSIGNSAFSGCYNLALTSLPDGITSIGKEAFWYCTNLATIKIDRVSPPTLGADAFLGISGIRIEVPASSVGDYKIASGWDTYADNIFALP